MPSKPAVIATGPGSYIMRVAFSPDGRSVACRDWADKEKAFDVSSGAALSGAPAGSLAWRLSEVARARIVRIHRFTAVVAIVRLLAAVLWASISVRARGLLGL
jgi:dipeptidyl aminopeptidase/acylaminoacyl peptidase